MSHKLTERNEEIYRRSLILHKTGKKKGRRVWPLLKLAEIYGRDKSTIAQIIRNEKKKAEESQEMTKA